MGHIKLSNELISVYVVEPACMAIQGLMNRLKVVKH